MRAKSTRAMHKTMAVILGNSCRQALWREQSYVPRQSHSSGDIKPMQAAPADGRGIVTHREGSVSDEVDSIQCFSPTMKVGQVEKLSSEMVHEARLDRVIVRLTFSESEVPQVPRVEQDCQTPTMVPTGRIFE